MLKFFLFDTETMGLPKNYNDPPIEWPRLIEVAWGLYTDYRADDMEGEKGDLKTFLIKPEGWEVPDNDFQRNRGYTQERSMRDGEPLRDVLQEYIKDRQLGDFTVAHNISFDSMIMRGELMRHNLEPVFTSPKICTMRKSTKFCNIPQEKKGGLKWPTLSELHKILFDCDIPEAHLAANDVRALASCFFELKRRGVITL